MRIFRLAALLAAALGGCAAPSTQVRTVDQRPRLAIEGAPPESVLYVDGLLAGPASRFNGDPEVLIVEPGTHKVSVRAANGGVLFDEQIFVESELKTLKVH